MVDTWPLRLLRRNWKGLPSSGGSASAALRRKSSTPERFRASWKMALLHRLARGESSKLPLGARGGHRIGFSPHASTTVIDVTGPSPVERKVSVPARSVVIPVTRTKRVPAGNRCTLCSSHHRAEKPQVAVGR